ncbi:MAG TPA: CHRD domain-containing protein [Acidimicrobiales bacterium]|nr:CHRD domain-containing protein [Acidimicrobiales bacterium]
MRLRRTLAPLAALTLAGLVSLAAPAEARATTFTVTMTGAEELPPGDPDGVGTARFTIDPATDRICFVLLASGVDLPIHAAHIHLGGAGEIGSPVVNLPPMPTGRAAGCVTDPDADAIVANPAGYYVNVHNSPYPFGALRAQLA